MAVPARPALAGDPRRVGRARPRRGVGAPGVAQGAPVGAVRPPRAEAAVAGPRTPPRTRHGAPALPAKTRELQTAVIDSTAWDSFAFRDGDIIISTYAKAGTTWVQAIVANLLFGADPAALPPADESPWIDMRSIIPLAKREAVLEAQTHRRYLKTHLPVDALVTSPMAKYVYVGRDGRDVMWSMHNHHANMMPSTLDGFNTMPGRVGPPLGPLTDDVLTYWRVWMERDGHPWWPFWHHIRSWWAVREHPNVMLLHFNDLLSDLSGCVARLAAFLDIPASEELVAATVHRCSFGFMKAHAEDVVSARGAWLKGGATAFINKGTNGRWLGVLPDAESEEYERRAVAELGPDRAKWLKKGGRL